MAKKLKAVVRLQIEAGKANPAPPIGPALAAHGINLMQFCKEYNSRTQSRMGEVVPAEIGAPYLTPDGMLLTVSSFLNSGEITVLRYVVGDGD